MLLRWAQANEVNKAEFIKSIWSKLIPSKAELENQARYADDGSKQIELAQRILARIESQAADDAELSERKRKQHERDTRSRAADAGLIA